MKVAMWTSWETRCGIAAYTADLVAELRRLGVEVEVVPVPYTDRDSARMAERLERLNAADLVHLQHEYTFFGGIIPRSSTLPDYYRQLRRPLVVTPHTLFTAAELLRLAEERRPRQRLAKGLLSRYPPYVATLERAPFARAEAIIVPNPRAREKLLRRGIRKERVHVIPWGTPTRDEAPPTDAELAATRARLDLEGRKVVTIFGYVNPDKGYEVALEALGSLPPAVKLVIAGGTRVEHERTYMERLRNTLRARGLNQRAVITGYLDERQIAVVMALSDVVLVPHTAANSSYSVMVALSYAKPVLASDLDCFRDIYDQGQCIELFETGDDRSLAERLGFLLASASARKQLSAAAGKFAHERSWPVVAAKTAEVYRGVLGIGP